MQLAMLSSGRAYQVSPKVPLFSASLCASTFVLAKPAKLCSFLHYVTVLCHPHFSVHFNGFLPELAFSSPWLIESVKTMLHLNKTSDAKSMLLEKIELKKVSLRPTTLVICVVCHLSHCCHSVSVSHTSMIQTAWLFQVWHGILDRKGWELSF